MRFTKKTAASAGSKGGAANTPAQQAARAQAKGGGRPRSRKATVCYLYSKCYLVKLEALNKGKMQTYANYTLALRREADDIAFRFLNFRRPFRALGPFRRFPS